MALEADMGDIPSVAAQDLGNILKQGFLEKKRRDHSFFGSEWQKRWCVLNNSIFYYFGSEKDKQQKGSFYIGDYGVQLVTNLRKDSKKTACFELFCPGRRSFQFTASSPQEAREWVDQINFVLRDLHSTSIPCDDDEEEEEETYDDIEVLTGPPLPRLSAAQAFQSGKLGGGHETGEVDEEDEDIYEVLPDEDLTDESSEKNKPAWSSDYANYYQGLWDCQADESDELSFQRGDLIYIISKPTAHLFPSNQNAERGRRASQSSASPKAERHITFGLQLLVRDNENMDTTDTFWQFFSKVLPLAAIVAIDTKTL
ncbi:hypothetical protein FQN60_002800 [Etheostoma spectabile]|uniref:PH domain-containing protein n=1 Tax=Etheostoma spectabile TaxID=54343 RepID=A0A5J5CKM5_9PERO|nr:hypothetical protein FQN60_002800 [Etheostoma spectabile]